eukprot:m.54948 g.54948  ORF g.54948 m.54948 type:complete len:217 (+) comp15531_c0_seq4:211-861(+)
MAFVWRVYQNAMRRRPLLTNTATRALVMLVGDGLAQTFEKVENPSDLEGILQTQFDTKRSITAATWQSCFFAPTFFFWFRWLDARFPGASIRAVVAKVVVNQAVITFPINAGYIGYTVTVENMLHNGGDRHKSPQGVWDEIAARLKRDIGTIAINSCFLWLPVNTLNFLFVPPHLRVLPSVLTSVAWSTYLSITAHNDADIKVLVPAQSHDHNVAS